MIKCRYLLTLNRYTAATQNIAISCCVYFFFFFFTPSPTIQVLLSHKHTRLSLISGLNGSTWQVQSVLPPPAATQAFLRLPNSFILCLNKVLICFETLRSSPAAAPVAPRETQCGKSLFFPPPALRTNPGSSSFSMQGQEHRTGAGGRARHSAEDLK